MTEDLKEVKDMRDKMIEDKGKSIVFNTKIKDLEKGEQCTRYFFKKAFSGKKTMATVLAGEEEVKGERLMEEVFFFLQKPIQCARGSAGGGATGIL